jgi:hypothetical protein
MGGLAFSVFVILAIVFLFSLFVIAEGKTNRGKSRRRPAHTTISQAGSTGMQRAGYAGGPEYVQVADIGLLAYRHTNEPKLVRYGDVLMDTRYLRPFVDLALPYAVSGMVRFELMDDEGRLRYADEARYELDAGKNTVLPGTWLPLEGKKTRAGNWHLRVLAGGALVAVHVFGWQSVGGGAIQRYSDGDGEIGLELQRALQSRPHESVSLSELLADQEE